MTLSKLSSTTIVCSQVALLLSLMATLSPPVRSLETGYDYETGDDSTTTDRYGDLKCTYLFAGITHMRLLRLMLEDKTIRTSIPVGMVNHYRIRAVICTLYDVADVEIGSLWLLLLYACTVQSNHDQCIVGSSKKAGRKARLSRLIDIHDYVTNRMQKELSAAGCRPGNQFDSYDKWYVQMARTMPDGKPDFYDIHEKVLRNRDELDILLDANDAQSTFGERYEALKSRQLFLNNLGTNTPLKFNLVIRYHVNWEATFQLLEDNSRNAHVMYFPIFSFLPLYSIKKYYITAFSLFKGIMYRLTWKFLLYVGTCTGQRRENYLKKWHDLLVVFQKLLRIENDPESISFLNAIDRIGSNDIGIDDVIKPLSQRLHEIDVFLHCEATDLKNLQPDQRTIDVDVLTNAQTYIDYLRSAFYMVDFDVIRSIMSYIDDESKW